MRYLLVDTHKIYEIASIDVYSTIVYMQKKQKK